MPAEQKLMKMAERGEPDELAGAIGSIEFVRLARPAPQVHSAASAQSVELAPYRHFHP